jgi:RNA polymerase sigma-70 factor (ECF subfamily)
VAATPPPAGPDDLECVRRSRNGDHDAFRVLVERYQGRAFRQAIRILRNEEAARDAVQEAFVKAYISLDRFEERASFFTWLYRLVTNQCIDMKRREHGDRRVDWREGDALEEGALPLAPEALDAAPASPIDEVARKEIRERMATAIEQLPETTRETLLLREVDGLAYAEIAAVQGIPRGTVMSRLHYARRKLSELLRGAGVAVEDAT